ncbi:hypothetical protein BpHYR1_013337 [Brachionus plicatilis]|uniref:Uncharacterized protein n=1 Tax=Brachionus plicatilis TaxID=10195 RepID=A0A3M7QXC2_BRAPC|nr:hypothetical protein BpHYR1_013337 [Brachionus plicatilis]
MFANPFGLDRKIYLKILGETKILSIFSHFYIKIFLTRKLKLQFMSPPAKFISIDLRKSSNKNVAKNFPIGKITKKYIKFELNKKKENSTSVTNGFPDSNLGTLTKIINTLYIQHLSQFGLRRNSICLQRSGHHTHQLIRSNRLHTQILEHKVGFVQKAKTQSGQILLELGCDKNSQSFIFE